MKRGSSRKIALERIKILMNLAEEVHRKDMELAQRYYRLAWRLALKARLSFPLKWKKFICRRCKTLLFPGVNATVRMRQRRVPHVTIRCMVCGGYTRYPYKSRKI